MSTPRLRLALGRSWAGKHRRLHIAAENGADASGQSPRWVGSLTDAERKSAAQQSNAAQ